MKQRTASRRKARLMLEIVRERYRRILIAKVRGDLAGLWASRIDQLFFEAAR